MAVTEVDTATRFVQECLLEGLRAFAAGHDPLLEGLARARRGLGARRGMWISVQGGPQAVALCDEDRLARLREVPNSLASRWIQEAPTGRTRLLGPDWLRRDPRAAADGLNWALVARSPRTAGVLWFDASTPLGVDHTWVDAMLEALEHLDVLSGRQAEDRRFQRLRSLGERAAGVAHDLRNQVSLAQLELRRLQLGEGVPAPELAESLRGAHELCRDFLGGGPAPEAVPAPLRQLLVEEIEAASRVSGRAGDVQVRLRCRAGLEARYEARRLRRALRNLLLNAIAATPAGAAVRVEAERSSNGCVDVTVSDEGRGMSKADLDRLLHAGESRGGTGFGTSSVLDCVAALSADLEVESEPGGGTRVRIRLAG